MRFAKQNEILSVLLTASQPEAVRVKCLLNNRELNLLLKQWFPTMAETILNDSLVDEQRNLLRTFLNDAATLQTLYRSSQSRNHSFLAAARNELITFFAPGRYQTLESNISKEFAARCLSDWRRSTGSISTDRCPLTSVLECTAAEAAKLMVLVERLALYYGGPSAHYILSDIQKFKGFALLSERSFRESAKCFEQAYDSSDEHEFLAKHRQYLLFFRELAGHRADWLDLDIPSARVHLRNALAAIPPKDLDDILKGYYWGCEDLKRDEQLLAATEAAAAGDAPSALNYVGSWLEESAEMTYTSARYHHMKMVDLTLRWLAASGDADLKSRARIRPEMMARMEGRDIRFRSVLYCVHLLDRAKGGEVIANVTKDLARILSPDAFPPEGAEQVTKYIADEVAFRAKDLLFLPGWLTSWAKPGSPRWQQEYALQVYAGVTAEFWSRVNAKRYSRAQVLATFPAWFHVGHALDLLKQMDLELRLQQPQRDALSLVRDFLEKYKTLEADSESNSATWDLIQRTAADLFPHIAEIHDSSKETVPTNFMRVWQKQVRDICILGRKVRGTRSGYYYLSPWFNFYEQDTYQPDPRERIIALPAALYGRPGCQVVLLCEGKSDKAAFEYLLNALFPHWGKLKLVVFQTRGKTGIPFSVEFADRLGVHFVSVPDLDAGPFFDRLKHQSDWAKVLELVRAEPVFYLTPDLEGSNTDALLSVVTELNPHAVYDRARVKAELDSYVSGVGAGLVKPVEGGTLQFLKSSVRKHWERGPSLRGLSKSEELGRLLAQKWLVTMLPKSVAGALNRAIGLTRGLHMGRQPGARQLGQIA